MKCVVAATLIVACAVASPSLAATAYFYVVLHPVTHMCSVVDTKPKDASTIVVIMDGAHISRVDAERGLNAMMGCANYRSRGA